MNLKCEECGTEELKLLKQYWNDYILVREVECVNGHITEITEVTNDKVSTSSIRPPLS